MRNRQLTIGNRTPVLDKLTIWARTGKVWPLPAIKLGIKFRPQKFDSYREMNEWKTRLLERLAERGGVSWKK